MAAFCVPRVVAEYRTRNRAEFQDAAAVVDPTVRAAFCRGAWALAVTALLWPAACVVSVVSLVGSAHMGSGAFGVTATVFLAVIGITVATGVALRRLLGGVPSGALIGMMGIGYVGSVSEAGVSGPQQIAGAGLAGFAGLLMLVLDRAHRTARRAGAARE
ncbi:hypothetical protein [Streptomyces sp. NPDC006510]|uniref:hypothetical protein n=1 Tax=Streptomyces sp. NPDC006510 TaxID=3155600 RepID=UPI0033BEF87C